MVFTIAVTCSFWYYDVQGRNPITTAYKWFYKSAFGSVTFASLVIAIVTFARMIIDSNRKNTRNAAVAICLCIVSCLMKQIEALLQILNHFSIICMAVTGENFIDSAKSTIGIICS
jgi:integral membrane sensor domain MASE1